MFLALLVLITVGLGNMSAVPFGPGIDIWRSSGSRRKRFRLNRKTPAYLVGHQVHARPRVWKRLHFSGHLCTSDVDCKRGRYKQQDGDSPVFPRAGVG